MLLTILSVPAFDYFFSVSMNVLIPIVVIVASISFFRS